MKNTYASLSLSPRAFLDALLTSALAAVDPLKLIPRYLPEAPRDGRTIVIGAGKAAARMAQAVEAHWQGPLEGLVVTRYGHAAPCRQIEVVEAGHPVPDAAGALAAQRIMQKVSALRANDLVICLISGGGSSLLTMPAAGISHEEKRALNKALLASGAKINEMNCVRRHLSAIKGGRLAQACFPARVETLVISDIPGDDPSAVASGPTVPDGSTPAQALEILARYRIAASENVYAHLRSQPDQPICTPNPLSRTTVIATAQLALDAAAERAQALGVRPLILSNRLEGEARDVGLVHAGIALQVRDFGQPVAAPAVILSGGETTVTMRGDGHGGRNTEFLLSLAVGLDGASDIYGLACDTDGIDGSEDNAGAYIDPTTLQRGQAIGANANAYLQRNDTYSYFKQLDDLIITGPTRTNVNDFRAMLVL